MRAKMKSREDVCLKRKSHKRLVPFDQTRSDKARQIAHGRIVEVDQDADVEIAGA
jgi:hypothetical protein